MNFLPLKNLFHKLAKQFCHRNPFRHENFAPFEMVYLLEISNSDIVVIPLDRLVFKQGCLEQEDMDNLDRLSLLGAWCVQCQSGREEPGLPVLRKHHRDIL